MKITNFNCSPITGTTIRGSIRAIRRTTLKGYSRLLIAQRIRVYKAIKDRLNITGLWRGKFYSGKNY